jgi:hypothetical protein
LTGQGLTKAETAQHKAQELYPDEFWLDLEDGIFIATGRTPKSNNQRKDLQKELVIARHLVRLGSVVYLLPEEGEDKHPDAVVDGIITEFKTITGGAERIQDHYREARKKADNIFFRINSDISTNAVLRNLIERVRKGGYSGGLIMAYFAFKDKLYYWREDKLK